MDQVQGHDSLEERSIAGRKYLQVEKNSNKKADEAAFKHNAETGVNSANLSQTIMV